MKKIDFKKEYKDLYLPKQKPVLIDVPEMYFITVDGEGGPRSQAFQNTISTLYALTFTIKMSKMSGQQPEGYFDYVVPPLEALWWDKENDFDINRPANWAWTAMIRQPEFVTANVYQWALQQCSKKKPELDLSKARFETVTEGKCVQILHIGPYADETASFEKMEQFMEQNKLVLRTGNGIRKHREIYLSDPRKTSPEKLKTVLRLPVKTNTNQ